MTETAKLHGSTSLELTQSASFGADILTLPALDFLQALAERFTERRDQLLQTRVERAKQIRQGVLPDFLPETESIRNGDWKIAAEPADLQDRRVEITGPVDRKMVINALNSNARVFMADFEDAHGPTWQATIEGQQNLRDAVNGDIEFTNDQGKHYQLNAQTAVLMVRPRGLHLPEKHVLLNGKPIPASLFDFGLFLFHNAWNQIDRGTGPYFYIPKLESHLEARWWNDVFNFSQDYLGIDRGTIKATVLIETIMAAFEMDEILYELKDHSAGLNCGRWDYIFSFIKKFQHDPAFVLPDRADVTMTSHFLRSYSQLLIKTCHRRGAHAMGGMAAQIPIKNDEKANAAAFAKVLADKQREVGDGHDGTWIAHPGLAPAALEAFDAGMPGANQLDRLREDVQVSQVDLLQVPEGKITSHGMQENVSAALSYIAFWLNGLGCVPLNNLMEDAATAEIARAQLWQWVRYPKGVLEDGTNITIELVRDEIETELSRIRQQIGEEKFTKGKYPEAAQLLDTLVARDDFAEFLTLQAYQML